MNTRGLWTGTAITVAVIGIGAAAYVGGAGLAAANSEIAAREDAVRAALDCSPSNMKESGKSRVVDGASQFVDESGAIYEFDDTSGKLVRFEDYKPARVHARPDVGSLALKARKTARRSYPQLDDADLLVEVIERTPRKLKDGSASSGSTDVVFTYTATQEGIELPDSLVMKYDGASGDLISWSRRVRQVNVDLTPAISEQTAIRSVRAAAEMKSTEPPSRVYLRVSAVDGSEQHLVWVVEYQSPWEGNDPLTFEVDATRGSIISAPRLIPGSF